MTISMSVPMCNRVYTLRPNNEK